jgi:hypothetical protein
MRIYDRKRSLRAVAAPVYCYETDLSLDRVIRDPLTVLLGRSTLAVQREATDSDPYNRVGRWMRGRAR